MKRETKIEGKIWCITDEKGNLIDDIDTDMIFHNSHLHITDINEMGKYAFGNLKGWEDFSKRAKKGDILVVGKNFGAGSSRQQAVDCFIALGISAILAKSFGAIYKRNCINSGLPILEYPEDVKIGDTGDKVLVDFKTGEIKNLTKNLFIHAKPFSKVQMEIYQAGNLFNFGKK